MMKKKLLTLMIVGTFVVILINGCKGAEIKETQAPETLPETVSTEAPTTREEIPSTLQPETKTEEMEGELVAGFPTELIPMPAGTLDVMYSSVAGTRGEQGFYANATVQTDQPIENVVNYYEDQLGGQEDFDLYQEEGIWTVNCVREGVKITINVLHGDSAGKTMVALLGTVGEN